MNKVLDICQQEQTKVSTQITASALVVSVVTLLLVALQYRIGLVDSLIVKIALTGSALHAVVNSMVLLIESRHLLLAMESKDKDALGYRLNKLDSLKEGMLLVNTLATIQFISLALYTVWT